MKRSYLAVGFALIGTVASARMIAPVSRPPDLMSVGDATKSLPAASPIVGRAVVSTTRPPVPLVLSNRPSLIAKTADVAERDAAPASAAANTVDATNQESNERTADFAKSAIEFDGYKSVKALTMGADGLWHGRAMRGATEIAVSVDAAGNVSAQ